MNLSRKLSLSATSLILMIILSFSWLVFFSERSVFQNQQESHFQSIAERLGSLANQSMLEHDAAFTNYSKELQREPSFVASFFVQSDGKIIFHSDPLKIGSIEKGWLLPQEQTSQKVFKKQLKDQSGQIVDFAVPVFLKGQYMGTAHLWLSQYALNIPIYESLIGLVIRMFFISVCVLILGMLAAGYLSRSLLVPIEYVVTGMRNIAENKLLPLPQISRNDELGWMANELNITMKKLKELDEMKAEFISSITHEFRSPLTAMELRIASLIKGRYGSLSSGQQDSLLVIRNNVIRLGQFVDDLLASAKLEAKRSEIYIHEFDLVAAVGESHKLFKPVAEEKQISFPFIYSSNSISVNSDQGKINQIMSNLISNALKFTDHGEVSVQIEEKESVVLISVKDSGHGISEIDKSLIFNRFYRSPSTADSTRGTGLGLSIAKSYCDLLGIEMTVQSEINQGSTFSILIPKIK